MSSTVNPTGLGRAVFVAVFALDFIIADSSSSDTGSDAVLVSRRGLPASQLSTGRLFLRKAAHRYEVGEHKEHKEDSKSSQKSPIKPIDCTTVLGLTKFAWALLCDILSLILVLMCIPLLLTCSRRRPPGAPLFDFGCKGDKHTW
eukprot:CAMPEP_0169114146 /NCGR_PEP_ID=MMETSP1015-20121227/28587_1 /TAXON_ID=342587 /ORGANISM="Karlodinium micrum, Strain CCMP2283" /LENGTH=144 /DNA_ID=CAMNT_0009176379 /DNA_START=80 /DNA_END=511 /DNA_ORIENTATION=+